MAKLYLVRCNTVTVHRFRSDVDGTAADQSTPPGINLNSEAISVDPGTAFFTFDYPYAGTTAVCTSDDRGITWNCNRQWCRRNLSHGGRCPDDDRTIRNQTKLVRDGVAFTATDRGSPWTPTSIGGSARPQTEKTAPSYGKPATCPDTKILGTCAGILS